MINFNSDGAILQGDFFVKCSLQNNSDQAMHVPIVLVDQLYIYFLLTIIIIILITTSCSNNRVVYNMNVTKSW